MGGNFGGIADDELKQFMKDVAIADDAGVTSMARFSRSVATLLAKREIKPEQEGIATFVLSDSVANELVNAAQGSLKRLSLLSNGNDPIVGRVWIASGTLKDACFVDQPAATEDEARNILAAHNLDGRPTVLVDARNQPWLARLYPLGMAQSEHWIEVHRVDGPLPAQLVEETVTRFWRNCLRTPALTKISQTPVWQKAAKGIPMARPEQRIQSRLHDVLFGAFPRRRIRSEQRTEEGRGDIFIIADTTTQYHAPAQSTDWVLELKALCDMRSTATAVPSAKKLADEAIRKGLSQAIGYKKSQNGVQAALCCFDMRKADEGHASTFAVISGDAAKENVHLWHWYLFRSSTAARA